jgi:hypothetical protein
LEEISDWLTKIIVGLSLINFNKILNLTYQTAKNIATAFSSTHVATPSNKYFAFSYALIVLFTASGFMVSYLWSFTILRSILIRRKLGDARAQAELDPKVASAAAAGASQEKVKESHGVFDETEAGSVAAQEQFEGEDFNELRSLVQKSLANRPIKVVDDTQKGRWGGLKENNGKKIIATVTESKKLKGLYDVSLKVSSTDKAKPLTGIVAFFVDSTFGFKDDLIYSRVNESGIAEVSLVAYEAFTVGVMCSDGTTLEIDLDDEKGFPAGFYSNRV